MHRNAEPLEADESLSLIIDGGGNRPLALDEGRAAYRLLRGYADIFVLDRVGEARRHLFRVEKGGLLFSMAAASDGRLVAIGGLGSSFGADRHGSRAGPAVGGRRMGARHERGARRLARLAELADRGRTTSIFSREKTCSAAAGSFTLVVADEPAFIWNGRILEAGAPFRSPRPANWRRGTAGSLRPLVDPTVREMAEGLANLSA